MPVSQLALDFMGTAISPRYEKWAHRFLNLAKEVSSWSKDPSTQVGAVIVRPDKTVCSLGYNGFPRSMLDTKSLYEDREEKLSRIIHAEINALLNSRENVRGYTLYTYPFIPCDRCMVMIIQAGISSIVSLKPSKEANLRWEKAFEKSRQYAYSCGVKVQEIEVNDHIPGRVSS
jgi:dCMP deaminase